MVRIVLAAAAVMLVSAVAFTVQMQGSPRGTVEVKQLAESAEPAGRVEVKELPPPEVRANQKGTVEVKQLPAPEVAARPAVRKS